MLKHLIVLLLCVSFATAQTKGKTPVKGKGKGKVKADTSAVVVGDEPEIDPFEAFEFTLPIDTEIDPLTGKTIVHKNIKIKNDSARAAFRVKMKKERNSFKVYTKRSKKPNEPLKLCINITAKDTNYLHSINDSIVKDPEVAKLLFDKTIGDTTYMLIYIDSYTKLASKPACAGGKETKFYYVKWVVGKSKPVFKAKTIASCYKGVTNMTKTPVLEWDKQSILTASYHKGSNFVDITFDPANPQKGLQSTKDGD